MSKAETGIHIGKIDPRYVLPKDELDAGFKESFMTAPSHLQLPTRNHFAFLEGVIGINPAKERVRPDVIVETWKPGITEENGRWRFMTLAEKKEFIHAARAITNNRVQVPDIETALRILKDQVRTVTNLSLDRPDGDGITLRDSIDIPDTSNPAKRTLNAEDIEEILSELTPREADVLRKRADMTLEEIGKEYGVSKQRIEQIEKKARKKLRQPHLREKVASLMEKIS